MNELTEAQTDTIEALKQSYKNYNELVQRIIELADKDYDSMYELRRAILNTISQSLHEAGRK